MKAITIINNLESGKVYRCLQNGHRYIVEDGKMMCKSKIDGGWKKTDLSITTLAGFDFEEVQQYKPVDENTKPGTMIYVSDVSLEFAIKHCKSCEFIMIATKASEYKVVAYEENYEKTLAWRYGWEKLY